jgi:hypothetical protein
MNTMSITSAGHDCDHGFCSVCGAVWPCSRARRAAQVTAIADSALKPW